MDPDLGRNAQSSSSRDILMEVVEHVKAHRPKKEKQQLSFFQQFITGGNEKADEPANKMER